MNCQEFRDRIKSDYYETKLIYPYYAQYLSEEYRKLKELYRKDQQRLQKEFESEFKAYIEFHYIKHRLIEDKWKTFFDYVYDASHSEGYLRIFEFGIEIIEVTQILFVEEYYV